MLRRFVSGGRAVVTTRRQRTASRVWRGGAAPGRASRRGAGPKRRQTGGANGFGKEAEPTALQLKNHFMICAVPMVGFGLMDNTVMIHAGNAIDCTLGVAFGLSTLAAAACGQVCSDASGVLFGGILDRAATSLGLPRANLSLYQRRTPVAKRVGLLGSLVGVVFGCSLGLLNLFLVDTKAASVLKLRHDGGAHGVLGYTIDVDNTSGDPVTVLTVEGPDVDGLLASLTAAIANSAYSLVTCAASAGNDADTIRDVFVVQTADGAKVDDDHIDDLARVLLAAAQDPLNAHALKAENASLQHKLMSMRERIDNLEEALHQASVRKTERGGTMFKRRRDSPPPHL